MLRFHGKTHTKNQIETHLEGRRSTSSSYKVIQIISDNLQRDNYVSMSLLIKLLTPFPNPGRKESLIFIMKIEDID